MRPRISWSRSPEDLGKAVIEYGRALVFDALVDYLDKKGDEIVAQMIREASWTDRTGEARDRLTGAIEVDGTRVILYLITGAPHGVYLELRWGGRYAIVSPTIPRAGIGIANDLKARMRS